MPGGRLFNFAGARRKLLDRAMKVVHRLDMVTFGRLGVQPGDLVNRSRHQGVMEHQLAQVLVIVHYLARCQDFLFEILAQQPVDGRAAFLLQKVVIGFA